MCKLPELHRIDVIRHIADTNSNNVSGGLPLDPYPFFGERNSSLPVDSINCYYHFPFLPPLLLCVFRGAHAPHPWSLSTGSQGSKKMFAFSLPWEPVDKLWVGKGEALTSCDSRPMVSSVAFTVYSLTAMLLLEVCQTVPGKV